MPNDTEEFVVPKERRKSSKQKQSDSSTTPDVKHGGPGRKGRGPGRKSGGGGFGGKGWSGPCEETPHSEPNSTRDRQSSRNRSATPVEAPSLPTGCHDDNDRDVDRVLEVSEKIGEIVASEIKANELDPSQGDAVNAALASTAAVRLLASVDAFGLNERSSSSNNAVGEQGDEGDSIPQSIEDFRSRCKKPLSELLSAYGEQDLDFRVETSAQTVPSSTDAVEKKQSTQKKEKDSDSNSCLAGHGKAPIHIELMSFGYSHGIPPESRNAFPLVIDCRDLPEVPPYMQRHCGLQANVKRALLHNRSKEENFSGPNVRERTETLTDQAISALLEAIHAGHGHGSPLKMTMCVGSETGRHRSVVVCELAATAIRKRLRANDGGRITSPVSVGTRHRDIDRRPKGADSGAQSTNNRSQTHSKSKQRDLESD